MVRKREKYMFRIVLFILGCGLLLQSCAPAYRPTSINMPFLKEEGDLVVGAATGSNNIDAQAAYAITDRFSMMLALSHTRRLDSAKINKTFHYNFEVAPGFHTKISESYLINAFAGYASGRIENYASGISLNNNTSGVPLFSAIGRYDKMHLQASIAFVSDFIDMSLDNKLINMRFPSLLDEDNRLIHRGHNQFYELGYTVRAGYKGIKISHQFATIFKLNNQINYSYSPFYTNLGIHISLNTLKLKEKLNQDSGLSQ